jgi:DNA polymerase I-like protein with 3'-5' exonuclease and polymerase domains
MAEYWKHGWVETLEGQRRHEPMNRNEIINHPIQGTAGRMVIDAQTRLSRIAYEQDYQTVQPIMNIHDDLSFYLLAKKAEADIEFIAREMILTPFDFGGVPLSVEVSAGDNWCDKEEIATFTTKDFQ